MLRRESRQIFAYCWFGPTRLILEVRRATPAPPWRIVEKRRLLLARRAQKKSPGQGACQGPKNVFEIDAAPAKLPHQSKGLAITQSATVLVDREDRGHAGRTWRNAGINRTQTREGDLMKRISIGIAFAGVAALSVGCGKFSPQQESPAPRAATVRDRAVHDHSAQDRPTHGPTIDQEERTIELQAQRAKRDIDDVTAEAESALERVKDKVATKAAQRARELSEASAELAEQAKDKAEDVPEAVDAVDDAVERAIERRFPKREKRPEPEERDTEYDADGR